MHILHLNQRNQILFRYLRDKEKKKEGGSEKKGGGENSPISPPLDPRLIVLDFFIILVSMIHSGGVMTRHAHTHLCTSGNPGCFHNL